MNTKITLFILLICTSSFSAGMEQGTQQIISAHPIQRQTSGKSTVIAINESPLPVVIDRNTSERTSLQRIRYDTTLPCQQVPRTCVCLFAAAVLVYILFTLIPVPQ